MSGTPPSSSDAPRPHTPLLEPSSSTGEDLGDGAQDEATEGPLHQNIPAGIGLMILGIFGEYLGRIYLTLNRKPQATVRQVYRRDAEGRLIAEVDAA